MTFPFPIITPKVSLSTLTLFASATSTTGSVAVPSTVLAGDLLVIWDVCNGTPTSGTPAGFTSILEVTAGAGLDKARLSLKIATGAEAGGSIAGMAGGITHRMMLGVFRGDSTIAVATPLDVEGQGTTADPTPQTVNASGGTPPLIVLGAWYANNSAITGRTFSPAADGSISPDTTAFLAYKIYNASPADVTVDMPDIGTNLMVSCYIQCS